MKKDNILLLLIGSISLSYYFVNANNQKMILWLGIISLSIAFLSETIPYISKINRFANAELKNIDTMSGIDFEEYVAFLLDKHGYEKTKVTQAQSDQGIDIITRKDSETIGIQCKRWKRKVGNKAIQEVYSGVGYYSLDKAIVITNSYFTDSAKELAARLNVELWDRNKLVKLIRESKSNS